MIDKFLIHYTHLLNAFSILNDGKVIFGDIKRCNDFRESQCFSGPFDGSMFIFCCSTVKLNAGSWLSYASGNDGVAIKFVFKKDVPFSKLFIDPNNDIKTCKIKYVNDLFEYIPKHMDKYGQVKDRFFAPEKEFRFYRYFEDFDNHDDELVEYKINYECLERIEIFVNKKQEKNAKKIFKEFNVVQVKINNYIK